MDIQDIKKRYSEAYIEDFGDFEIVHIDKKELDWLIAQAEKVEGLQQKLDVVIDELGYALRTDKHKTNKDFYIKNAIRFIEEVKEKITNSK